MRDGGDPGHAEPWLARLRAGAADAAWDLFIARYRRLIVATIRHLVREPDDVMEVFAEVCAALHRDDLARIRRYWDARDHAARFSTWLVAVVRNLTVDWIRARDGRPRAPASLPLDALGRRIFEHVFAHGRSHVEAYELIVAADDPALTFGAYLRAVAATYRVVDARRGPALRRELAGSPPLEAGDDATPPHDDPAAAADARERVAELLRGLAPDERLAVLLFVVEEMPAADVARLVRWPNAKAVDNRVHRALSALRGA
ncbi:MAG: RNA polymerase sigma factor, partial [Gemmatimonadaceae bacterium]